MQTTCTRASHAQTIARGRSGKTTFRDARAHRMHQYCTGPKREANFQHARAMRARIKSTNFAPRRSERPILHRRHARAHDTRARIRCTKYGTAPQRETNFAKTGARRRARTKRARRMYSRVRKPALATTRGASQRRAVPHSVPAIKVGTAQGPQPL